MIEQELSEESSAQPSPLEIAWRKSRPGLFVVGILSFFINLLRFATPIYILQMINQVVSSGSFDTLIMLTIITLFAVLIAYILIVIRRQLLIAWGNWIMRFFGPPLFVAGLQDASYQDSKISGGQQDVNTVRRFVASEGLTTWIDVFWAPVFIGVIFFISPMLGYITLAGSALVLILGALGEIMSRNSRNTFFAARKDAKDWINATERNRETIESLNITRNFARRWCSSALVRQHESTREQTIRVYVLGGIRAVARFVRIGIFATGIWLVISHELTVGAVIAASALARTGVGLIRNATLRWRETVVTRKAYERMRDALENIVSNQVSQLNESKSVPFIVKDASYRYSGQSNMLFRDINVSVNPGEALFVIGNSASGKTTFVRLASGLFSPRWGQFRLGDMDVVKLQRNSNKREIGTLMQETTLFRGTVRENIAGMLEGEIEEVIRAAKMVGIHDVILHLPQGYDTPIIEHEPLLSMGQRKAVALARAFYGSPPLVILDEPFPHLDKTTTTALHKAFEQLKADKTILLVTSQYKSDSKYADKVILFERKKHRVLQTEEDIAELRPAKSRRKTHRKRVSKAPAPVPE